MFGKFRNFFAQSEKIFQKSSFSNEKCSKHSSGHSECSFDKPCGIVLPKVQIFFTQNTKLLKNQHFSSFFSLPKFFSGHLDWSFGNPAVNFRQGPELFRSKWENLSKIIVFSKKNAQKIPLDTPNAALTTHVKLFHAKSVLLTQSTKLLRNHHFFNFFSLNFLRTRRLKFQTPCRQFYAESGTFSLKVRKSVKNHRFSKQNRSKDSSGNADCSYDNPCRIVLPKIQLFSVKVQNY